VLDAWEVGDAYQRYIGRWSEAVARGFVSWLGVPPGRTWLDVGCGTGALTGAVLALGKPGAVIGGDPSRGFVERAAARADGALFVVADARALPFSGGRFDVAVAGLVLNFVPEPGEMVAEMRRVARGVVGAYVWDYAGKMQLLRRFWDAAVALDPGATALDEGARFPVCRPEPLRELFWVAGLGDVEVRAIDVPTVFPDFEDLWEPFLGGQGPAPGYVASLDEASRVALRERLRQSLAPERDGSIRLSARAWAVKGRSGGS
jgi:SAM-dependent methyltransferase